MSFQPTLNKIIKYIETFEKKPDLETSKVEQWLNFKDVGFIIEETSNDWIMIQLMTNDYFFNSYFVNIKHAPLYKSIESTDQDFGLSFCASSYISNGTDNWLERSFRSGLGGTKLQPIFFYRSFDGYDKNEKNYYEILQDLLHVSDVHWVESKNAYCLINDVGDIEEKIVFINKNGVKCILANRNLLEQYMGHGNYSLLRFFEVKRYFTNPDWGNHDLEDIILASEDKNTFIRHSPYIDKKNLTKSFDLARGSNLICARHTVHELEELEKNRKYESFIIQDWKNNKEIEWSSSPDELDSYFVDTGKPLQTSPVFFNPDVLLKYKIEPEKYEFNESYISCRGAWSLRTYDLNEVGQVHTYICYLGDLPYKEQLHWKQYNEKPKGKISERAFKTDFLAEWITEYNPLAELKESLKKFPKFKDARDIWIPQEPIEDLFNKIHYVTSGKVSEYKDFLMALTILVIDGFQAKTLASLVSDHKDFDMNMKSLGLLRLLLVKNNIEIEVVETIIKPLRELQTKRSKYGGHGGAKPEFDLIKDSRLILESVESAIKELVGILSNLR
jgi:hypothetical protein